MPKPAPCINSKNLKLRLGKFLGKNFIPWACLGFIVFAIYEKSESLVNQKSEEKKENITKYSVSKKQFLSLSSIENKKVKKLPVDLKDSEWCELPYDDLSRHKSILAFADWLREYEDNSFQNNTIKNDPRIKWDLINRGKTLAKERAKIFVQIIKGDPQKALELSVSQDQKNNLPPTVSQHVEKWVSTNADIKTMHVCFDPKSPQGMILRKARFLDGEQANLFSYGRRKFIPTVKNLAIWGVKLNNFLAISEKSYRLSSRKAISGEVQFNLELGGETYNFNTQEDRETFSNFIDTAEEKSWKSGTMQYPIIAGSTGHTVFSNYQLVGGFFPEPFTWGEANASAGIFGFKLACIENEAENKLVYNLLKRQLEIGTLPSSASEIWIGGEYNSTKPGWSWTDDSNFSNFNNWKSNFPANPVDDDYAVALDLNDPNGGWIDRNRSERKYALMEFVVDNNASTQVQSKGRRKILVVPARFYDEGNYFEGSSGNPIDSSGNPISGPRGDDSFEPDSRENLIKVMEEVQDFYLRNSDQKFHLDYVISPTVTMDYPKWQKVPAGSGVDNRIFDSTGNTWWSSALPYDDKFFPPKMTTFGDVFKPGGNTPHTLLGDLGPNALQKASNISDDYNFDGLAFQGVTDVTVPSPFGNYTKPVIVFNGGAAANGNYHPNFKVAKAEARLKDGKIYEITITDNGAYYQSTPTLSIFDANGSTFDISDKATVQYGKTCVSWVLITTQGNDDGNTADAGGGLGFVGAPGSHVTAKASGSVTAHELGHNFGLFHANKFISEGYSSIGDEGSNLEYGNSLSVMGTSGIGGTLKVGDGDLTIVAKGYLSLGYKIGRAENNATDIIDLSTGNEVSSSLLREENAEQNNTFRIYRHDYGSAPYPLNSLQYDLNISKSDLPKNLQSTNSLLWNFDPSLNLYKWKPGTWNNSVYIGGPGESANANLYFIKETGDTTSARIHLRIDFNETGKGYSEEPILKVLDENNQSILTLDPTWFPHSLLDLTSTANRGLRGVRVPANKLSPYSKNWFSYRTQDEKYGLWVMNGSIFGSETSHNYLIDTTPSTPGKFEDAALLLGRTFSEYDEDVHVTPISRGGIAPMEYLDVVVNIGTIEGNLSHAPAFSLVVSNTSPQINEYVNFTVVPDDSNNTIFNKKYAYSWYLNEVGLDDYAFLNRSEISRKFTKPGFQIVKVVVSDLRGGISSRNIIIKVGNAEQTDGSLVSGKVKSKNGFIQGAKVVMKKAPIIEHSVRVTGDLLETRISTTNSNHLKFVIDDVENKQITLNRGEIHRFTLDSTTQGKPITFFDRPDHQPAKVGLKLFFTPLIEFMGTGYLKPPKITFSGGSLFDSYYSDNLTNLYEYQNGIGSLGTLIRKPLAKSLLSPTEVIRIKVQPVTRDSDTNAYITFGGYGHLRDFPPGVTISRSSYWENYNESNASASAVVDGVGTIKSHDFNGSNFGGSNYPTAPDIVMNGAGVDFNSTATIRPRNAEKDLFWQKGNILHSENIDILDQGKEFDPNSTLPVALYPHEPFAYWSFDENETLYESNETKFNPTPGFNDTITQGLVLYWKLDGNKSFTKDSSGKNNNPQKTDSNGVDVEPVSVWGVRNKAIKLPNTSDKLSISGLWDSNYTVTCWLNALETNSTMRIFPTTGNPINFTPSMSINTFTYTPLPGDWFHFGCVWDGTDRHIYINGDKKISDTSTNSELEFTSFSNFLLDEVKVYNRKLDLSEIRQLAGKLFLDLSGNRLNAVPIGAGFEMNSSILDPGSIPNELTEGSISSDLGNAIDLNGSRYLDLTNHKAKFSTLRTGSFSFWVDANETGREMTLFSASKSDSNGSYYRLFLNENGSLKQEVFSNENELCKIAPTQNGNLLTANSKISTDGWHHIVVTIADEQTNIYIDGVNSNAQAPAGSTAERAFLADIEGVNHIAIGHHITSVVEDYFVGKIDEFHIYDRILSMNEITYLLNLGLPDKDVLRARLHAEVDAIGTIEMINYGNGYQDVPEVLFDYDSTHYSGLSNFRNAVANAELNSTTVEKIILTQKFANLKEIELPDGRVIQTDQVEIVKRTGYGQTPPVLAKLPDGISGYSAPPQISVQGTHNIEKDLNATAYALMYLDVNQSAEILYGGHGYNPTGFTADSVRIFGEGYRPPKFKALLNGGSLYGLKLIQAGEGNYTASTDGINFFSESGGNNPEYQGNTPWVTNDKVRTNVTGTAKEITGISFKKPGGGWQEVPTVYLDWGNDAMDIKATDLEFNASLSHVMIQDPGFGYSVPVEVDLVGGLNNEDNASDYIFERAICIPSSFDSDGGITGYDIIDPGQGYITPPLVNITGGGGMGATAIAEIDISGQVSSVTAEFYGRGYRNRDLNNTPVAIVSKDVALLPVESNAMVKLHLGGALKEPPVDVKDAIWSKYSYPAPWFEILDRGRTNIPESEKAEATAKVVDGNITKVIVTKSGKNYIDPYVKVFQTPPGLLKKLNTGGSSWVCMNQRQKADGNFSTCRHIIKSDNIPTNCTGESGLNERFTATQLSTWQTAHRELHPNCTLQGAHGNGLFSTLSCSGTTENFVLVNDPHRLSPDFDSYDLNCSAITENGMIREIIMDSTGTRYYSPRLLFSGTGSGVDAIPVFNSDGKITRIFYDDNRTKNLELDQVQRPSGAGHGFTERPFTKDYKYSSSHYIRDMVRFTLFWDISYQFSNKALRIDRSISSVSPRLPNEDFPGSPSNAEHPVSPSLQDAWGDRVSDIEVINPGLYETNANLFIKIENSGNTGVDFNATHANYSAFQPASAVAFKTNRLTNFKIDRNGTYQQSNVLMADQKKYDVWRSTFLAEPTVEISNHFGGVSFSGEDKSDEIFRLNGQRGFEFADQGSHFDLVVDDRVPNKFYYGLENSDAFSMGGEILVKDGMFGLNWGSSNDWDGVGYTDENGYYSITNLEPGFYNIAVIMEDEKFQDITFRPDSNLTLVSRSLYVPGFDPLVLQSDGTGNGKSALIWSNQSRAKSISSTSTDLSKTLEGIGGGFKAGEETKIQFRIDPFPENTGQGTPNLTTVISSIDGTLKITIEDDENSTTFDITDKFTVSFASTISGIDFTEDFEYLDSNNSYWGGVKAKSTSGTGTYTLILSPQASGNNNLEIDINSLNSPQAITPFNLTVFDENGSDTNASTGLKYASSATWNIEFDQNVTDPTSTDTNKTLMLSSLSGSSTNLTLFSSLRGKGARLIAHWNDQNVSTRIRSSNRVKLTSYEEWLDKYFYSVSYIILDTDTDGDGLKDSLEWTYRTNPLIVDTDDDNLTDSYEISTSKTNPRSIDTDGDGFADNVEWDRGEEGFDPLIYNTSVLPSITALYQSGSAISSQPGSEISIGAIAVETSFKGIDTNRTVTIGGTFLQVVNYSNSKWMVNKTAPSGTYKIVYSARDSLNRTVQLMQDLIVTAIDVTKPIISLSNNGPIYILKGTSYTLPTVTALDNEDGVLTSSVSIAGESMVDLNKTGTYSINYSVSDAAGNIANATLNLIVEDFAFTLNGKAIDGYLTGSTVLFDGKADVGGFDGLHDLDRTIITDASGSFSLQLTPSELSVFDLNNNNLLDASEGRIIITGGYDPTIDTNFTGRYQTDVNSSVVSPLSTLVTAIMDQGLSKEEAKNKVISAFGLATTIDPTNYDPIAASLAGESTSSQYLLATARLANAMKQADALGSYLSIPTTSAGQVSTAFVSQLAQSLSSSLLSFNPLDDSAVLNQAFSTSLQTVQSNANISEVSSAVTLLQSADNLLVQTINAGGTPNILAVSLAKNQQAVEDAIIEGYSNPSLNDLSTLASTATTSSIQLASNAISSINVFPPVAENFQSSIRATSWSPGSLLMNISASDGDGDSILYSITTANFDLDADGNNPFVLSSSGALSINDIDDLLPYAGTTVDIKLSLSDGKGMSTTIVGALSIDNKLSLDSTPINGKQGWVESTWFKTFYSAGARWIYHPAHEWLYVSPDNLDGYWFWDSNSKIWWWTKPTVYPYFYRSNGIWNYWHFNQNSRVYFDYQSNLWITP